MRSTIDVWAKELGFAKMGVCNIDGFFEQKALVECQPPLKERAHLRFEPLEDYPWATALAVLLWKYYPAPCCDERDHVFIDSYYYSSDQAYKAARELEQRIKMAGYMAQANVPYPAKAAAMRAGLGMIGDHGLLITPEYGTRVVIILLATNAIFPETPMDDDIKKECLHCGKCAEVCPTAALTPNGMEHPQRCLRNYMLEGSVVPVYMRSLMGMKLVGCDMCQRVCPLQRFEAETANHAFVLDDFVVSDEKRFRTQIEALGRVIGKNVARPQRVRAQAALLAGNRKSPRDLDVLRSWSQSEFEAVREHAVWAIKAIENDIQGLDQSCETR